MVTSSAASTVVLPASRNQFGVKDEEFGYMPEMLEAGQFNNYNNNNPSYSTAKYSKKIKMASDGLPQRYVIVFMLFLAFINLYMMYLNLSVVLPAMINPNATKKLITLEKEKEYTKSKSNSKREKLNRLPTSITDDKNPYNLKDTYKSRENVRRFSNRPLKESVTSTLVDPPSEKITAPKIRMSDQITREILKKILESGVNLPGNFTIGNTKITHIQQAKKKTDKNRDIDSINHKNTQEKLVSETGIIRLSNDSNNISNENSSFSNIERGVSENSEENKNLTKIVGKSVKFNNILSIKDKYRENKTVEISKNIEDTRNSTNNKALLPRKRRNLENESNITVKNASQNLSDVRSDNNLSSSEVSESNLEKTFNGTGVNPSKPVVVMMQPMLSSPKFSNLKILKSNASVFSEIDTTTSEITVTVSPKNLTTIETKKLTLHEILARAEDKKSVLNSENTTPQSNDTSNPTASKVFKANESSNSTTPKVSKTTELVTVPLENFSTTESIDFTTEVAELPIITEISVKTSTFHESGVTENVTIHNSVEVEGTTIQSINDTEVPQNDTIKVILNATSTGIPLPLRTSNLFEESSPTNDLILTLAPDSSENAIENSSDILTTQIPTNAVEGATEKINKESTNHSDSTTPVTIPCRTFKFVNCSYTGTYDVIDKKGINASTEGKNTWVTLRPLPQPSSNIPSDRFLRGFYDDDDLDEYESRERYKRRKNILFNLTDSFKLVNCSRVFKKPDEIECLSSHGLLRLSISGDDDSSSSSSSSSSEEDDDEYEDEDDDDDDEDEDGDYGDNLNKEERIRRRKLFRLFLNRWRKRRLEELRNRQEGIDDYQLDTTESRKFENRKRFRELNFDEETEGETGDNNYDDNNEPDNYQESSEEYGNDEEDDPEDENEEENDGEDGETNKKRKINNKNGTPIKLDAKIPSTVCFDKKFRTEVTYQGIEPGEFSWTQGVQQRVLSGYYWGLLFAQIPGGRLSNLIGGKILLLVAILVGGILTLLSPVMASAGAYWLLTGRVLLGITQGFCFPAVIQILAQWAPPLERTRMVAYSFSGIAAGAALGGPLCEHLLQQISWRIIFYGQGIFAILWALFWFFLSTESPSIHPRISEKEKQMILSSIGQQHSGKVLPIPWCSIIRSRHVLGLMLAQGSFCWAWHTLLHYAPYYMTTVLHRERNEVQAVWGAALGCMFVMTCVYGTLADWLRSSRKTSTESVRRAANSICSLVTAAFLVGVAQAYCNTTAAKVCFALAISIGCSGAFSGLYVNSLDLSPNHASVITGICGAFASTATILSPYYWSLIVYERPTLERWRTVWYTSAIFLLLANCLYFLLVGSKEQRWNRPVTLNKTPKKREEEQGAISRRRADYKNGLKNQAYASTENL